MLASMLIAAEEAEVLAEQATSHGDREHVDCLAKRRRMEEHLRSRSAFRKDRFCEAVIVEADLGKVKEERSHDIACICRQMVGRYFKVGMVEGSPVYRQERCVYTPGTDRGALIRHTHGA